MCPSPGASACLLLFLASPSPLQTTVYLQYMAASYTRLQMAGLKNVYLLQVGREGWVAGLVQKWEEVGVCTGR